MRKGEVWYGNLSPTVGTEQAGARPLLIVSADAYNEIPSRLVVVLPITSRLRDWPSHVRVSPPEGGLTAVSDILCEQVRAVARERLTSVRGTVTQSTLEAVAFRLRLLLDLGN
jgi:mRNA interferase MazF